MLPVRLSAARFADQILERKRDDIGKVQPGLEREHAIAEPAEHRAILQQTFGARSEVQPFIKTGKDRVAELGIIICFRNQNIPRMPHDEQRRGEWKRMHPIAEWRPADRVDEKITRYGVGVGIFQTIPIRRRRDFGTDDSRVEPELLCQTVQEMRAGFGDRDQEQRTIKSVTHHTRYNDRALGSVELGVKRLF